MRKNTFYSLFLVFALMEIFGLAARVRNAEASGTIYIRADGSIEPLTANITSFDNITYSFTSNNYDSIVVEKGNIIIDGAGYTLQNPGGMYQGIRVETSYPVEPNNVTIKNLKIKGFLSSAILLQYVMQCKILDNVLTENGGGIEVLQGRTGYIISGNKIINNGMGIYLSGAKDSIVYGNDIITNSQYAIGIHFFATNNTFYQNNIIDNNLLGYYSGSISISGGSNNNRFYNNNVIGNAPLVYHENINQANVWDDGARGNYWSDYSGQDSDKDGIGDTPHIISGSPVNVDHYPLMNQIGTVTRQFTPYYKEVIVSSNSTVQEFSFNDALKQISFNVTGADGTTGFCNITFPIDLLWGTISLYKDNVLLIEGADYAQVTNGTHHSFYITYAHTTHTLKIVGTEAIPEFPSAIILPLFIILSMIAVVFAKKKRRKESSDFQNLFLI